MGTDAAARRQDQRAPRKGSRTRNENSNASDTRLHLSKVVRPHYQPAPRLPMETSGARGRRITLIPNGRDGPRVAFRLPSEKSRDETVRLIMERLALPGRSGILAEDVQAARFYLQDGSLVLDFDVLDHSDEVHVAFDGKQFVPPDSRSALLPGRVNRMPPEPSVPPPNKAYMASLREVRDALLDEADVQATAPLVDRPRAVAARSLASATAGDSEGAIANRVMARSLPPAGTEGRATPGSAEGFMFVRDGPAKQGGKGGEAHRVIVAAGVVVAVLLATIGAWVLLRAASATVYDRLRAPTCAELGHPAGCVPLPPGCYPPAPWMRPLLEDAADEAVGRMPTAPYPPSMTTDRLPLRQRSFLSGLFQADAGPQLALRHVLVHDTTKPPMLDIGACWRPDASRAQLVPDRFVFRFYDWHALLGAEYTVEEGAAGSWRRRLGQWVGPVPDRGAGGWRGPSSEEGYVLGERRSVQQGHIPGGGEEEGRVLGEGRVLREGRALEEGRVLGKGVLSVLAAGAVLLEHIPLWDLGRKGVNVTGCDYHFWPVRTNATDTGGGDGAALADEAAASGAGQLLAASLGPLLCDWFNRSNSTGDVTVSAGLEEFVARNPGEVSQDAHGGGRVGGGGLGGGVPGAEAASARWWSGGAAGGAAGGRALEAMDVEEEEEALETRESEATGGGPEHVRPAGGRLELSVRGRDGPPWRGLRLEMDVALDDVMPLLLAKVRAAETRHTCIAPLLS